jgi:hypothetical protein
MQNTKIVKLALAILNAASMEATFAGGPSGPQENLLQDSGSWEQVYVESNLGVVDPSLAKARIWMEAQSRTDNNFTNEYQGLARVGLGYSVTDRATIWGGYTYLPTDNITAATPHAKFKGQQDAFSAFRYVIPTSFGTLSFRTMFEANFLPYNNNEVRYRPRQMVKYMHPMEFEPRLSVIGWDEFFLRANTTTTGGQSGFDQNRAFAGLGWTFNKNFRAEGGYMNQYLEGYNYNATAVMHHLVMASLFVNF